jgi:Sec-independent protein translocase protein TatA
VFGPKKTIEMAQAVGRTIAQLKHATGQFQSQLQEEVRCRPAARDGPELISITSFQKSSHPFPIARSAAKRKGSTSFERGKCEVISFGGPPNTTVLNVSPFDRNSSCRNASWARSEGRPWPRFK